jgi:hypothetical protein
VSGLEIDGCYRVLGVRSDADLSEIKSAFRRLAREYHPDRNKEPGAEERFNAITEAYGTILRAHGITPPGATTGPADAAPPSEFGGKLDFTIFTDKEVVFSVSPRIFEQEIRKRFNPALAPGTSCRVGRKWFEVDLQAKSDFPLFRWRPGKHKILIEWYKASDGTDKWRSVSWDQFWSYVRKQVAAVMPPTEPAGAGAGRKP